LIDEPHPGSSPASAVLVSENDWTVLTLSSVLRGWGIEVARAATAADAVALVRAHRPDVLLADVWLPAEEWAQANAALRTSGELTATTPVVRFAADDVPAADRLAALADGAWDVVQLPLDTATLRLRLATWIRAKRHADELEERGFLDPALPLYNTRGLLRRARELGADSARAGSPLACVAISLGRRVSGADRAGGASREHAPAGLSFWNAWRAAARQSDVIGRVGASEFAVLAPRTNAVGGEVLVERLRQRLPADARRFRSALQVLEPAALGSEDAVALVSRAIALLARGGGTRTAARLA
jgi:PleD family two-component response regulator